MPLVTATAIRKSFAGVRALDGVSFDLQAGEVHALVGENGAGKSTLIRILTGAERADAGQLTINGAPIDPAAMTPALARERGIAVVYQQPALFPDLTVAENVALVVDRDRAWRTIGWTARRTRARDLLARAGAVIDPDRLAGSLSMPEQQLVEVAKAIGTDARVVLMDEPTASLTDREVAHLFTVVSSLRERGVGVLYISHRLEEVFALADRITILRDGRTVASEPCASLDRATVVRHMAGRNVEGTRTTHAASPGPVALELRGVTSRSAGVRNISLAVRRGEILGISGLVGSGRTELAELVFGLRRADAGEVLVGGQPATIASPSDAIAHGIAYVPEDRRRHGVVPEMSIAANTSLAVLPSVSRFMLVDTARERALASEYVRDLRIRTSSIDAPVATLSGGNQQKVALSRWLATAPTLLILDEPTQGVDVGAKAEIHAVMRTLVERGLAVIMISSELPELLAMSDRIVVMRQGTIAGEIARADATTESVLALALGHAPERAPTRAG